MSERSPTALKEMMARAIPADGKPAASPRKKCSFIVSSDVCSDAIDQDIELTIGSLTSQHEIEAARQSKGDSMTFALNMAKFSLMMVNGTPISRGSGEGDWLWENLTSAGRQIVMGAYTQLATPSEDAQKKAQTTTKLL